LSDGKGIKHQKIVGPANFLFFPRPCVHTPLIAMGVTRQRNADRRHALSTHVAGKQSLPRVKQPKGFGPKYDLRL